MKSFVLITLALFSFSAFADYEYSCYMTPGEQGGHSYLVRIKDNKAEVFYLNVSDQRTVPSYLTTLEKVSSENALIEHYIEKDVKEATEFFIRRGTGFLGDTSYYNKDFKIVNCQYREIYQGHKNQ